MNWRFWDRSVCDTCAAVQPLLSLLSDDMASEAERRRVEAHLADCSDCRQALEWMQATRQVIALRPSLAPPDDLCARIARAIAAADAAQAPPVKAPVVAAPARRPLRLRPALAYGLSLALAAGIVSNMAWHSAAHPAHTTIAARPIVAPSPAPRVADTGIPNTSVVVNSLLGQFGQTLRSALVAPAAHAARHSPVRPEPLYVTHVARIPAEAQPTVQPSRVAREPLAPTAPHLTVLPRQLSPAREAVRPPRHAVTPEPIAPAPHIDNHQVASATVPPRVETPTLVAPPPAQVRVEVPTATHAPNLVAERAPSVLDGVSRAVAEMHTVAFTSNAKVVKAATHFAVADMSSDRSGTAAFVSGPVR